MTISLPAVVAGLVLGFMGGGAGQATPGSASHVRQGDAARGQRAFLELGCHSCHAIAGLDLPAPVAQPRVPVDLAGKRQRPLTDADLLTAIMDPSHSIAPADSTGETESGGLSRMGDYSEAMTVRQLVDLVAFIRSRRELANSAP